MNPVVFLDIDGVMNRHGDPFPPFGWYEPARGKDGQWGLALPTDPTRKLATFLAVVDEGLVDRARDLVNEADADLVIASGWRKFMPMRLLIDMLAAAGWPDAPIIGQTPAISEHDRPPTSAQIRGGGLRTRHAEVLEWVDRYHPTRYVLIDDVDEPEAAPEDLPVVAVDGRQGLTKSDCEQAAQYLGLINYQPFDKR